MFRRRDEVVGVIPPQEAAVVAQAPHVELAVGLILNMPQVMGLFQNKKWEPREMRTDDSSFFYYSIAVPRTRRDIRGRSRRGRGSPPDGSPPKSF